MTAAGWGNVKRHALGEGVRPCEKAREKERCLSTCAVERRDGEE